MILITTCIYITKTRDTTHRAPTAYTGARNTGTDAKRVAVLEKESNKQVLIAIY